MRDDGAERGREHRPARRAPRPSSAPGDAPLVVARRQRRTGRASSRSPVPTTTTSRRRRPAPTPRAADPDGHADRGPVRHRDADPSERRRRTPTPSSVAVRRRPAPTPRRDGRDRARRGRRRHDRRLRARTAPRSPSRPARRTARTAPTSTSGRSATPRRRPITTDHRSVFGSWAGDTIVGSTVVTSEDGLTNEPAAFMLATDGQTTVAASADRPRLAARRRPDRRRRRLLGRHARADRRRPRLADRDGPPRRRSLERRHRHVRRAVATPLTGDQAVERSETTIAEGPLTDWDARWDETGTRLAVWIADARRPDRRNAEPVRRRPVRRPDRPRQSAARATSRRSPGFSIADGRLAWAAPAGNTEQDEPRVRSSPGRTRDSARSRAPPGDFLLVR